MHALPMTGEACTLLLPRAGYYAKTDTWSNDRPQGPRDALFAYDRRGICAPPPETSRLLSQIDAWIDVLPT
jgi:hypothetical protein